MAQTLYPVGTQVAFFSRIFGGRAHPLNGSVATVVESRLHVAKGKKYFKYTLKGAWPICSDWADVGLPQPKTFELKCEDGEAGVRVEPVRTSGGVVTHVGDEDVSFQDGYNSKFQLTYARLANYGISKADLYEGKIVMITATVELPRAVNITIGG